MAATVTRRQALAGIAGVGLSGSGLAWYSSKPVAADVALDEWSVNDAQFDTPVTPVVDATVQWQYEVHDSVDFVRVDLLIDDEPLASEDLNTSQQAADGDTALTASVTDHSDYTGDDFGHGTETRLSVGVRLRVYGGGGSVLAEASTEDTATVTVAEGAVIAVGGSAQIIATE